MGTHEQLFSIQNNIPMHLLLLIITAYLIATLWEHYFHRDILHASTERLKKWKNSNFWFYRRLYHGYYSHHVVHHKHTFKSQYTQQFDSPEQKARLDTYLINKFGETNDEQDYGLTINTFNAYSMFMLPWIVLLPVLILTLERYEFVLVTVIMMLPMLLSKYIHPKLHDEIKDNSFFNNPYIKLIYKTHYIHHQDDTQNFNLLWGGDWLRGSYTAPSKFKSKKAD